MGLFDELEALEPAEEDVRILRAPFGYIGGKNKSLPYILPKLPYRNSYIEVFGGSGVVLLNRRCSKIDVYNDRFGGVTCFYRCLRDADKMQQMVEWLQNTCYSKEEYYWCRDTWADCSDDVERACRWYYSMANSFGNKGHQWGRCVTTAPQANLIRNKLKSFHDVHKRFSTVQIENASWQKIMKDYDHPDAVFYLDPPYVGTSNDGYHHDMNKDEHRQLIHTIENTKGFVALSGFSNPLYESIDWDDRITWNVTCTLTGNSNSEGNNKGHLAGIETYGKTEEVLWIKEAR